MTNNDTTTFNRLFAHSYNKVKNYLKSLCRNSTEAEDITQDTFVRAFRFYHTFDHRSSFDAWVMQIARNQYLDSIRRTKSRVHTVSIEGNFPDAIEHISDEASSPEWQALHMELDPEIAQAISALSPSQRQLLQWIAIEQLTYSEVATRLSIPLGTVKSRYGRALKEARLSAHKSMQKREVNSLVSRYA